MAAASPDFIKVYIAEGSYLFEPVYPSIVAQPPRLQITRPAGNILVNEPVLGQVPPVPSLSCHGLLGMIQLLSGPHLILITERQEVARVAGQVVWRIKDCKILPCAHLSVLSDGQQADEQRYVAMLQSYLQSAGLYYSSLDLTRPLTPCRLLTEDLGGVRWAMAANRAIGRPFFGLEQRMPQSHLAAFLVVAIEGFVGEAPLAIAAQSLSLLLISRRSTARVGKQHPPAHLTHAHHILWRKALAITVAG